MNYLLGYIVCSLIVWLLLHGHESVYATPQKRDDELLFVIMAIILSPITICAVVGIMIGYIFVSVYSWIKTGGRVRIIALALIALGLTGCAGYTVEKNGSISTYGVLRTLTVRNEYYESGKLKTNTISTDSTTKDALLGLNELIDTTVTTAAKLKP